VWRIHPKAWLLVLLSAVLQVLIFPLPNLYLLCWVSLTPLIVGLLQASESDVLQLERPKLQPARPLQGFVLGYGCGIVWYAGTCYWIFDTMHRYGGLGTPMALLVLLLFCLYLGLYHGLFGLLVGLIAGKVRAGGRVMVAIPFVWVAVELARTRITGFPWNLLGVAQVGNIPLARIAAATGVYGVSFEIMLVNTAFAAAFLLRREKRNLLLIAAASAAVVLQAGRWLEPPPLAADRSALLVQANVPILESSDWTRQYFDDTIRDLMLISSTPPAASVRRHELIVWPESPAPFFTGDPAFRAPVSALARQNHSWLVIGATGTRSGMDSAQPAARVYNSAALITPDGEWTARYDKVHLVPFGEYVPFKRVFAFASGLTEAVGEFGRGGSRAPLEAGDAKLGTFICYESIFPDEVRRFTANGAQVLVNISNDGWYGDSGAYAQHLNQTRMRALENDRWLLSTTNTGVTAAIDPYGRVVARAERKVRTALEAPFALRSGATLYVRYGDWFPWLCAIISMGALVMRFTSQPEHTR
jgi:apolipoprotein N-acyltransferase